MLTGLANAARDDRRLFVTWEVGELVAEALAFFERLRVYAPGS
jgi:hypothetical protein